MMGADCSETVGYTISLTHYVWPDTIIQRRKYMYVEPSFRHPFLLIEDI